jgi:mRNA-binding protein PUF3
MTSTVREPVAAGRRRCLTPSQTRNRYGDVASAAAVDGNDQLRAYNASSLGQAFATSSKWNSPIWGNTIGRGPKLGSIDTTRSQGTFPRPDGRPVRDLIGRADADGDLLDNSEAITGSGSLLQSSESDGWARTQNSQWATPNNISPGLASARSGLGSTSPVRQRTNQHTRSNSPYFPPTQSAIGQAMATKPSTKPSSYLDPTSGSFTASGAFDSFRQNGSRHNSDGNGRQPLDIVFGSTEGGPPSARMPSGAGLAYSGYNSSAASRSGSLPPSRHGLEQASQLGDGPAKGAQQLQFGALENAFSHRPNQLSRTSNYSNGNAKHLEGMHQSALQYGDLSAGLGKLDLAKEQESPWSSYYDGTPQPTPNGANGNYAMNANGYRSGSTQFEPDHRLGSSLAAYNNQYRHQYNERPAHSPSGSDARRNLDSPLYSTGITPPLSEHHRAPSNASLRSNLGSGPQALQLDRQLRSLHEQQNYIQPNQLQRSPLYPQLYDYSPQAVVRMNLNPLAQHYYAPTASVALGVGNYQSNRPVPRGPAGDGAPSESLSLRSTLLEEFRSNNKGNKRYELKVCDVSGLDPAG